MRLELSTWSIVKVVLVLLGFWVLFQIGQVLEILFVVLILVAALGPAVQTLRKWQVPRTVAVTVVTLALLLGGGAVLALIIPALVHELQVFIGAQFPALVDRITPYYETVARGESLLVDLVSQLQKLSGNIASGIITIFGGVISALTVLALTFYFLLEEHPLTQAGVNLWPVRHREQISKSLQRIMNKLGAWLRGQFLLSLIVGGTTAIALSLIGVSSPLAIGVLAGLLEIVPIIGPLVTGVIMVLMALISPEAVLLKVSLTLGFFIVLQLLEGQILVPNIMKQAIGLSPFLVIVALLIGSQLGGVGGAILAIPVVAILQVIAQDWQKFRNAKI